MAEEKSEAVIEFDDGSKFRVTPALKEAWDGYHERQKQAVEKKTEPREEPKPEPRAKAPDDDLDDEFWSNPKEALKRFKDEAKQEALQEFQSRQQTEQAQKQFWDDFYKKHKHLNKAKRVVGAVLNDFTQAQMQSIFKEEGGREKFMDKLAERTEKELEELGVSTRSEEGSKTYVEGGGSSLEKQEKSEKKDDYPKSTADILKGRFQKRQQARKAV